MIDEVREFPEWRGPQARGGSPVHLYLLPLKDQFYGDRSGGVTEPFGHVWYIATHTEDLSPEEIRRRAEAQPRQA